LYHSFKPSISNKVKFIGEGRIKIGEFTVIEDYVLMDTGSSTDSYISIGKRCKIKQGVILRTYDGYIKIGNRTSIGEYSIIAGHGGVVIGSCTLIAGHCYLSAANHIFADIGEKIRFQGETARGIFIGDNVWIGGDVMILDGVKIGDGCVVGAGSLVTRDLPPNTICYGRPCKPIKKREKPLWMENIFSGVDRE